MRRDKSLQSMSFADVNLCLMHRFQCGLFTADPTGKGRVDRAGRLGSSCS